MIPFFSTNSRVGKACLTAIALLFGLQAPTQTQNNKAAAPGSALTLEQVVSRLEERNQLRAQALKEFEGSRTYRLQYRGFPGSRDAEMQVEMRFQAPASKRFKVLSQTGSKLVIDRVLMKLLQSEQEALDEDNGRRSALNRENYEFTSLGFEHHPDGDCYVLGVTPRTKSKFLYRGRIWVDAADFAVTHIEAEPAKNPSFWIKKTSIEHQYTKIGDFWLPAQNRTESLTRLGGKALLTIDYTNYKIISVAPSVAHSDAAGDDKAAF
jgi:hypothetical protein